MEKEPFPGDQDMHKYHNLSNILLGIGLSAAGEVIVLISNFTRKNQISANINGTFPMNVVPPKHAIIHSDEMYSCLEFNLEEYGSFGHGMTHPTAKYM